MSYVFNINKGSTLPNLRMSVVKTGRYDNTKINTLLKNSDVYFSMTDIKSGVKKILKSKCEVKVKYDTNCADEMVLEYKWKSRDTQIPGQYKGYFEIVTKEGLKVEGLIDSSDEGVLIVPISEELIINVIS